MLNLNMLKWNTNRTLRSHVKPCCNQAEDFCCDLRKELEDVVENPYIIRKKLVIVFVILSR